MWNLTDIVWNMFSVWIGLAVGNFIFATLSKDFGDAIKPSLFQFVAYFALFLVLYFK